jgi:hypothetical protein
MSQEQTSAIYASHLNFYLLIIICPCNHGNLCINFALWLCLISFSLNSIYSIIDLNPDLSMVLTPLDPTHPLQLVPLCTHRELSPQTLCCL